MLAVPPIKTVESVCSSSNWGSCCKWLGLIESGRNDIVPVLRVSLSRTCSFSSHLLPVLLSSRICHLHLHEPQAPVGGGSHCTAITTALMPVPEAEPPRRPAADHRPGSSPRCISRRTGWLTSDQTANLLNYELSKK